MVEHRLRVQGGLIMRRFPFSSPRVALIVVVPLLFACGSGTTVEQSQPNRAEQVGQKRDDRTSPCGQSKILGAATQIYDTPAACAADRANLKNLAKDDLIRQCNEYCAFLGANCAPNPVLTRDNVTADDHDCNGIQEDRRVHARAVAEKDCICKPRS
jgi:hypothetical protein